MAEIYQVGVDEVGRGPLAGPVYVCSLLIKKEDISRVIENSPAPLRDSKKLTEKMREKWFSYLKECKDKNLLSYVVSSCKSGEIDKLGIATCIRACVNSSLEKLEFNEKETKVYLDGGLHADKKFNQESAVKADENIPVVSLASIVAKVMRDKFMETISKDHPEYGFGKHKGYGTKAHIEAIKNLGPTPLHRMSFLSNIVSDGKNYSRK